MDAKAFVDDLAKDNQRALDALREYDARREMPVDANTVRAMLRLALTNEMEALQLAALWVQSTAEIDARLGFARQAGDEARHYQLIERRLAELGDDLQGFDPLAGGHGRLFTFLTTLSTAAERLAAGQFTREALALVKNESFIAICRQTGDTKTALLYEQTIQPDEKSHHELGRRLLERYAPTSEEQVLARAASLKVLELAEEMQWVAWERKGISHAPGC